MTDSVSTRARSPRMIRVALIGLALAGCGISGVLAVMAAPTVGSASLFGTEICAATARIDCRHVLRSEWARIGPVSATHLGFAYFAAMGVWFGVVGIPNRAGRRWHWVPVGVGAMGLAASVYFTYVMARYLPVWCSWCLAAHGVNLLLVALAIAAWPRGGADKADAGVPARPSTVRALGVLGGLSVAVLFVVVAGYAAVTRTLVEMCRNRLFDATNNAAFIRMRTQQAPEHDIPIRPDDLAFGAAEVPFTLVAFTDFECPHCLQIHHYAPELVRLFPGRLRVVFKHFPVCRACNPHVAYDLHHFACEAAEAAEAARAAGTPEQFRAFFDRLFSEVNQFARRPYERIAGQVGIDRSAFRAAVSAGVGRDRIEADIALGHALGAEGSGVVFLNGRRMPTWQITTTDHRPRIDPGATVALWQQILGAPLVRRSATRPEAAGP